MGRGQFSLGVTFTGYSSHAYERRFSTVIFPSERLVKVSALVISHISLSASYCLSNAQHSSLCPNHSFTARHSAPTPLSMLSVFLPGILIPSVLLVIHSSPRCLSFFSQKLKRHIISNKGFIIWKYICLLLKLHV